MEQDIPVYVLANFVVSDKDQYRVYEKGLFPILKRFGGHLVTFDDATETLEGPSPRQGRMVILGFLPKPKLALGGRTKSIKRSPNTDGRAQR